MRPTHHLSPSDAARELSGVIRALSERYAMLLDQAVLHREALRRADGEGVEVAARAQGVVLAEIADIETRRAALVNAAAESPGIRPRLAPGLVTLRSLAAALPEPERGRLLREAEELRALVQRAQEETRTIKAATLSLVAHMEGLMRQVARHISHAGTYCRRGFVDAVPGVVSAIDLRT